MQADLASDEEDVPPPDVLGVYSVVASATCPHASAVASDMGELLSVLTAKGAEALDACGAPGCTSPETWICLTCGFHGCSRFQNAHAHAHFGSTMHALSIGWGDLGVWCYACASHGGAPGTYIDVFRVPALHAVFNSIHILKHGHEALLPEVIEMMGGGAGGGAGAGAGAGECGGT